MVEGQVECKGEHHNKQNSQDHHPKECLEYALKHKHIETSIYKSDMQVNVMNQ